MYQTKQVFLIKNKFQYIYIYLFFYQELNIPQHLFFHSKVIQTYFTCICMVLSIRNKLLDKLLPYLFQILL